MNFRKVKEQATVSLDQSGKYDWLSADGLGTAQLGNLYREVSDQDAEETLREAWDSGIRYFDTAPHYGLGLSEKRVGSFLKNKPRNEFVLSTKVGRLLIPTNNPENMFDDEGFAVPADYVRQRDYSRDGILRSVEESLNRLGLDYIDVLYLHDPENNFEQASTEGIQTLIELREQGVVKAVGAGMNFANLLADLIDRADIDLVMCAGRLSLVDPNALERLVPTCIEREVGIVAAGVYNSGILSSPKPSKDSKFDYSTAPSELIERVKAIADVAADFDISLPELAIGYVKAIPAVVSTVLGARSKAQVQENVRRSEVSVPQELWVALGQKGLIATEYLL